MVVVGRQVALARVLVVVPVCRAVVDVIVFVRGCLIVLLL